MGQKKSSGTASPETKPAARLILSRLNVRGVLGIEDHTIDLGPGVNVIVGSNASGKSSHVQAIRSVLGMDRTSLVRLAHVKEDGTLETKPEVEAVLIDEAGVYEAHAKRRGDSSAEVSERDGDDWRKVSKPVEWLRDVIDVRGAQPALFLASSDAEKQEAILESLDLPYDRAAALEAADLAGFNLGHIPEGLHPLEDLELVEKTVRESRAIEGTKRRQALDAAQRIAAGLPAEPLTFKVEEHEAAVKRAEDLASEAAAIESKAADAERNARKLALAAFEKRDTELGSDVSLAEERSKADLDRKVGEALAAYEKRKGELEAEHRAAVDDATTKAKTALDEARKVKEAAEQEAADTRRQAEAAAAEKRTALVEARALAATLLERRSKADSDAYYRKQIAETKAEAKDHGARYDKLTESIEALVRYKLHLVEQSPIKGLALVVDPESGKISLTLDGVPLSQTNTGRLEELAVEVSLLRAAPPASGRPHLPIVLLDGIEALDVERRRLLLKAVAAKGVQVIAACVGDGPLRVLRGDEALA